MNVGTRDGEWARAIDRARGVPIVKGERDWRASQSGSEYWAACWGPLLCGRPWSVVAQVSMVRLCRRDWLRVITFASSTLIGTAECRRRGRHCQLHFY